MINWQLYAPPPWHRGGKTPTRRFPFRTCGCGGGALAEVARSAAPELFWGPFLAFAKSQRTSFLVPNILVSKNNICRIQPKPRNPTERTVRRAPGKWAAHNYLAQPGRPGPAERKMHGPLSLSEPHKEGHMTTGHRLFCKEILCFNTMPCRHMPVLVHF